MLKIEFLKIHIKVQKQNVRYRFQERISSENLRNPGRRKKGIKSKQVNWIGHYLDSISSISFDLIFIISEILLRTELKKANDEIRKLQAELMMAKMLSTKENESKFSSLDLDEQSTGMPSKVDCD